MYVMQNWTMKPWNKAKKLTLESLSKLISVQSWQHQRFYWSKMSFAIASSLYQCKNIEYWDVISYWWRCQEILCKQWHGDHTSAKLWIWLRFIYLCVFVNLQQERQPDVVHSVASSSYDANRRKPACCSTQEGHLVYLTAIQSYH